MAAPAATGLFVHNFPPDVPLARPTPPAIRTLFHQCRTLARALTDRSLVEDWVAAVEPLALSANPTPPPSLHPHHRQYPAANRHQRLTINPRALCYEDAAARTTCLTRAQFSAADRQTEASNTHTLHDWNSRFRPTAGYAGLVASPTSSVCFNSTSSGWARYRQEAQQPKYVHDKGQAEILRARYIKEWREEGGYYADWHCCAVYIAGRRIFIYDPQYATATAQAPRNPGQPRRITEIGSIAMVVKLIRYGTGPGNRRIRLDTSQIWIYRNDFSIQQQNAASNTTLRAGAGLDCVPLCVQWLAKIAAAWQQDPREWLQCDMSRPGVQTEHGALPAPYGTGAYTDANIMAAGWEKLRM